MVWALDVPFGGLKPKKPYFHSFFLKNCENKKNLTRKRCILEQKCIEEKVFRRVDLHYKIFFGVVVGQNCESYRGGAKKS